MHACFHLDHVLFVRMPRAFWKAMRRCEGWLEMLMGIMESPHALLCLVVWEWDDVGGCGSDDGE